MPAEPMTPTTAVFAIAVIGLGVSFLSALETRVKWIASFCALFGEGCRQTADFTMFGFPISWWGAVYYLLILTAAAAFEPMVFWLVFAGVGFELTFVYILAVIRAFCIFCFVNAFVVAALVAAVFDPARMWQAASAALALFAASYFLLWRENESRLSPEPAARKKSSNVYAVVDGKAVTAEEVERPISQEIHTKELDIFRLKKERLDKVVRNVLLKREAERQGKTVKELAADVTADVEKERAGQALRDYADDLAASHEVEIRLEKPEPRRFSTVEVNGSPAEGPEDAPVTVAEFSDYRCPACRAGKPTVQRIREKYGDRVRWVFKNFPLPQHEGAEEMALAAHCAEEQEAFWTYHERLFSDDSIEPDLESLIRVAEDLDLDADSFRECLESERHRERIEKDKEAGMKAGLTATPTFIVNGRFLSGKPSFEEFSEVIEEELAAVEHETEYRSQNPGAGSQKKNGRSKDIKG